MWNLHNFEHSMINNSQLQYFQFCNLYIRSVGNTGKIILLIMTSEQVWFKDYLCFACDGHLTLSLAMLEMHFGLAYNKLIYQVVLYQTYSGPNMKWSFSKKWFLSKLDYLVSHQIIPKTFKKVKKKNHNFDNLERTFLILALCCE